MPARIGKVKVTVNLDAQLVLKAKLIALRRSAEEGRTITLEELLEAGLREELAGEPERKPQTRATKPENRRGSESLQAVAGRSEPQGSGSRQLAALRCGPATAPATR